MSLTRFLPGPIARMFRIGALTEAPVNLESLDQQMEKYLERLQSYAHADNRQVTYFGQFAHCFKRYDEVVPSNMPLQNIPFVIGQTEEELSLVGKGILRGISYDTLASKSESGESKPLGVAPVEGVITPSDTRFMRRYGENSLKDVKLDDLIPVHALLYLGYEPGAIASVVCGFKGASNNGGLAYSGNWTMYPQDDGVFMGQIQLPFNIRRINPAKLG